MQLLVYPITVFLLVCQSMSHINTELKTAFVMQCEGPFLGGGSAIYNWLLFQYLFLHPTVNMKLV